MRSMPVANCRCGRPWGFSARLRRQRALTSTLPHARTLGVDAHARSQAHTLARTHALTSTRARAHTHAHKSTRSRTLPIHARHTALTPRLACVLCLVLPLLAGQARGQEQASTDVSRALAQLSLMPSEHKRVDPSSDIDCVGCSEFDDRQRPLQPQDTFPLSSIGFFMTVRGCVSVPVVAHSG